MDRDPSLEFARGVERRRDRYTKRKNRVITLKRIEQLASLFIVISNLRSVLIRNAALPVDSELLVPSL